MFIVIPTFQVNFETVFEIIQINDIHIRHDEFAKCRKTVSSDGGSMRVFYYNGDVKETLQASGLVKYFYSQTGTWHLTYPDKREVLQFQNGQEEVRYPDGSLQERTKHLISHSKSFPRRLQKVSLICRG